MAWVGSLAVARAFDRANFGKVGVRPFDEAWPLLRDHVRHLHIKDAVSADRTGLRPYPSHIPEERLMDSIRPAGEGEGHLQKLFSAPVTHDYNGSTAADPHLPLPLP